jgi:hypothetical protein
VACRATSTRAARGDIGRNRRPLRSSGSAVRCERSGLLPPGRADDLDDCDVIEPTPEARGVDYGAFVALALALGTLRATCCGRFRSPTTS